MRLIWLAAMLVAALVFPSCLTKAPQPHMLVVIVDDMGWPDVGFHGGEIATPTLDKLAKEGVDLAGFYSQPVCSQTRAALLTGRYPFRYGMQHGVIRLENDFGLSLSERTLAEAVKSKGYSTALIGKWHLGHHEQAYLPLQRGFDRHYGNYCAGVHYFTHQFAGVHDWNRDGSPVFEEGYVTDLLTQEALNLVAAHSPEKPLYLQLAYTAPHSDVRVPPGQLKGRDMSNPERAVYAAAVEMVDTGLAKVLNAMDDKGMLDNTVVVFLSDNGGDTEDGASNAPFRGGKGSDGVYEGGMRVPALIWWPKGIPGGQVIDTPIHTVDLHHTLLKLAGVSMPDKPLDGVDLMPVLTGKAELPARNFPLVMSPATQVLLSGEWKLLRRMNSRAGNLSKGKSKSGKGKSGKSGSMGGSKSGGKAGGSAMSGSKSGGKAGGSMTGSKSGGKAEGSAANGVGGNQMAGAGGGTKAKGKTGKSGSGQGPEAPRQPVFELYNLRFDPGEQRDLAAREPEKVRELSSILEEYLSVAAEPLADATQRPDANPGGDDHVYPTYVGAPQ